MSTVITKEKKAKIINTAKKVLLYTGVAVGCVVLAVALYQILQVLFVGAILLGAFLLPGRWRW